MAYTFKNEDVNCKFLFPDGCIKEFLGWDSEYELSFIHGSLIELYSKTELDHIIIEKIY